MDSQETQSGGMGLRKCPLVKLMLVENFFEGRDAAEIVSYPRVKLAVRLFAQLTPRIFKG